MAQAANRVGRMSLQVSAPSHLVATEGESFVRDALDKAGDELERRHPGQIFCINHLSLTWDLEPTELVSPIGPERYAVQLADAIEAMCPLANGSDTPSPTTGLRFSSAAEYWMRYLRVGSHSSGSVPWPFDVHGVTHPLEKTLYSAPSGVFRQAIHLLAVKDFDALSRLVSSVDEDVVNLILRQLGVGWGSTKIATGSEPPSVGAAGEALHFLLGQSLPKTLSARAVLAWAALTKTTSRNPTSDLIAEVLSHLTTPAQPPPTQTSICSRVLGSDNGIATEYAGVVFLLNLILEMELGELLWSAMLPEGEMLRRALRSFWADEEDGLLRLLFRSPNIEWPGVSQSQQQEIAIPLALRLATAWTRNDLADLPIWYQRELSDGWQSLWAAEWPNDPVLLSRDTAGWDALPIDIDPKSSIEGMFTPESALAAQIRGSLAALWVARVGASPQEFLHLPGLCIHSPEEVIVQIDIEHQDMRLRKAGLDRDPGWIEWIHRTVRIEYRRASEQLL